MKLKTKIYSIKHKLNISLRRFLNRSGIRKKKIFAVGFNKSGTTSLHALFRSLGFLSYHGVEWRACDNLELLRTYDCFSDDIPQDLAKLDNLFPGSKFILQVRDLDSWVYSRLAHIEREKKHNMPGGPEWDLTEYAIRSWIKKRNLHHLFVLSYFSKRPADLLVVNFIRDEGAAIKVCNFLGKHGNCKKPLKNPNPNKNLPQKYVEMLQSAIAELGIPESEIKYDIYCPSLIDSESNINFPVDSGML